MLSDKMLEALNKQVNAEMYSAYLYFSMSSYLASVSLNGFANWARVQAQEEMTHAMRFYNYINETGGRATMLAIDAPQAEWDGPLAVAEDVLEHEKKVTSLINDLMTLAIKEQDYATQAELQWFISEQVEEEASADEIVQKLKLVENTAGGLFMIDRELGQRTFTMPVWLSGE
ncbi:MAG TPA: ferritin [Candidatus Hydrogenedentes bacterium]|nr:ferritin [Candidatus Hydrogenedentota bacterium]